MPCKALTIPGGPTMSVINNKPVHKRDRFFMAMLKLLGIKKTRRSNLTHGNERSSRERPCRYLGIASTRRSFFARRKSFYRGFLIAVPAFLLAVEILVCRYVLLRKTPGSISRTVCLGAVKI
jgi:hypothetical protein